MHGTNLPTGGTTCKSLTSTNVGRPPVAFRPQRGQTLRNTASLTLLTSLRCNLISFKRWIHNQPENNCKHFLSRG